jgi:hypothetical protein
MSQVSLTGPPSDLQGDWVALATHRGVSPAEIAAAVSARGVLRMSPAEALAHLQALAERGSVEFVDGGWTLTTVGREQAEALLEGARS